MHKKPHSFPSRKARLRLTQRFSPWASLLPLLRAAITLTLIAAVLISGYRFLVLPPGAEALLFSSHLMGKAGDSIGILGVAIEDLNKDGLKDVAVANSNQIALFTHGGGHAFTKKVVDNLASQQVVITDINHDDLPDLVVALKNSPGVRWYRNNGDFNFTGFSLSSGGNAKVAVADLNGDGDRDIMAITHDDSGISTLRRFMGDGKGNFTMTVMAGDSEVTAIGIGDVNDNKYPDIITGGNKGLQRWATNDGLTWSRIDIDDSNKNSKTSIAVADMNGDGKFDILVGDQSSNSVAVYKNLDNSAFSRTQMEGDADVGVVVPADVDGDGRIDAVVSGQDDNSIFWFKNGGTLSFSKQTVATDLQSVLGVAVADIDNDKDLDFVAGDYWRGSVYWYEQTASKPTATKPTNISQSTNGKGLISFTTTVASDSFTRSRLRVEYSTNGTVWHKAFIKEASVSTGSVDVNSNNGYQIGTANPIDTDAKSSVDLTITWDTASTLNAGGAITGDISTVQVRVTPRDDKFIGTAISSGKFRVDRKSPTGLNDLKISALSTSEATLTWSRYTDSSAFSFVVRYGTDAAQVADGGGSAWDSTKDAALGDIESTGTAIKDLQPNKTYTFKLFVTDKFGNVATSPTVSGVSDGSIVAPSITPQPSTSTPPAGSTPAPTPAASARPTATARPTPPPTTLGNKVPVADAGQDQVVNPAALVIMDGTASRDADGDALIYTWRQLSGSAVELLSSRTATPSFSAGQENETYIFALTVRDPKGASATDIVTVATKQLPKGEAVPVATAGPGAPQAVVDNTPPLARLLRPIDILLFVIAVLATLVSVIDRATRTAKQKGALLAGDSQTSARGRVVHYRTGEPIPGVQVLLYSLDGKLKASERTNARGEFPTLFPTGQYTMAVQVAGFAFAPAVSGSLKPEGGILYTGGTLTVQDGRVPLTITIPLKPTGQEITTNRSRVLRSWQNIQRWSRTLSWPVFLIGALLNTVLIFWVPTVIYLVIELCYVILVIVKVALEVRVRPAYGLVRDAITHVPLDLAVVRLYEEGTNRLIMTRVTNNQGKFFALPPAGTYTVTVTKPGYAVFSKQHVLISPEQDAVLQITTDLMPVTPQSGLAAARAAVL